MQTRVIKIALIACTAVVLLFPAVAPAQQRDIMLVLDNSGSMKQNDPDFLTAVAVKAFIGNLTGDTNLGILIFDEAVDVAVPLSPLNVDTRGRYLDSLSSITFKGQWTHSSAALERALYELRNEGRPLAEKSIVFMTDGIVDTGDPARDVERTRWIQTELADSAAASGVRVFGIAFTDNADFQLIQSLAHRSGGEYYRAYEATDIQRVFESIDNALRGPRRSEPVPEPPPIPAPTVAVPEPLPVPGLPQPAQDTAALPEPGEPPGLAALPEPPTLPQPVTPGVVPEPPALPQAPAPLPTPDPLPSLTAPAPALPAPDPPAPRLPQAGLPAPGADDGAVPGSGAGASFMAELNAPQTPEPPAAVDTQADTQPDTPDTPATEPVAGAASPADAATPRTPEASSTDPPAPLDAEPVLPLPWLIAGGVGLALAVGAGVFVVVRRRRKPAAQSQVPKAFLNDLGGATDKSSHELGEAPTVIGRLKGPEGDGNHYIVIDETTIGRRHAIIDFTEHAYWVADQNSLNGTFVNGRRIKERTRLKHGDRIRFHRKEFEFVLWEMFETDRTEMSHTMFANLMEETDDEATQMRDKSRDRDASSPTTER